ncbi:MAG: hypothetical protein CL610_06265 [Anaerolineaceae bacterium]|nr:hypothetical protein [Anaerolineaceae bacterium]
MPEDVHDDDYGKMRAQSNTYGKNQYYRCRARDFSRECSQTSVRAELVEEQVIQLLKTVKPPKEWHQRMVDSMGELLGDKNLDERITEIKSIIERMDFRWDQGFIADRDEYLEQRVKLQQELEQLTPIPDDELEIAADILGDFAAHWAATKGDRKAQRELIQLIVSRVWTKGDRVVAVSLRPNFHVTLGLESERPTEISVGLNRDTTEELVVHERERRDSNPRSPP